MAFKHQFGVAEEITPGTFVAPNRWFQVLPGETIGHTQETIDSGAVPVPGTQYSRSAHRTLIRRDPTGDVSMEIPVTGFGIWLKHALGSVASVQPDAGGSPSVWEHTFTPGDLAGLALTLQKGVERTDGTVIPFAAVGSKIASWELSSNADEYCQFDISIVGMDVDDTSGLATASYPDPPPALLSFAGGSIEVDDTPIAVVTAASVGTVHGMNTDRRFLGSGLTKAEPKENAVRALTGELTAEFDNKATFYDKWRADSAHKLELIWTGAVIENAFNFELRVTCNDVRFEGDTPGIDSPDVPNISVPYTALKPAGATEAIEVLYRTTDTTP